MPKWLPTSRLPWIGEIKSKETVLPHVESFFCKLLVACAVWAPLQLYYLYFHTWYQLYQGSKRQLLRKRGQNSPREGPRCSLMGDSSISKVILELDQAAGITYRKSLHLDTKINQRKKGKGKGREIPSEFGNTNLSSFPLWTDLSIVVAFLRPSSLSLPNPFSISYGGQLDIASSFWSTFL